MPETMPETMPEYTLEQVAQNADRSSCWVALHGEVFDFTAFIDDHPGGARGILRHAGTDASDVFAELHSQSIFAAFGPSYRIGKLRVGSESQWQGVPLARRSAEGISHCSTPQSAVPPTATVLASPFPHDAFTGSGLETFRFHWSVADKLLRMENAATLGNSTMSPQSQSVPPETKVQKQAVHRQKSNLGVLDHDRDWLHAGAAPVYAAELTLKKELLTNHAKEVYVTHPTAKAAEAEVLALTVAWLIDHYPDRFECTKDETTGELRTITTLTPGYLHCFAVADFADEPLRLAGLLAQEDFCLLEEVDATEEHGPIPGTDEFTRLNIDPSLEAYTRDDHLEEHPTGKQHVLQAASCCFSFDAKPRHGKPMSAIHHPNVPGWYFHLQRGMNRLFSSMTAEQSWYRYTHDLQFSGLPIHVLQQDPNRPVEAFTGPFAYLVFGESPEQVAKREAALAAARVREDGERQADGISSGTVGGQRIKRAFPTAWERLRSADNPADFIRNEMIFSLEFQTLRRLPIHKRYILFTVRRYVDPMHKLEQWPGAAVALAAAIRRKYKGTLARNGLGERDNSQPILDFCDTIAAKFGLTPGLLGVLPEPWERIAMTDGTSAPDIDATLHAKLAKL